MKPTVMLTDAQKAVMALMALPNPPELKIPGSYAEALPGDPVKQRRLRRRLPYLYARERLCEVRVRFE